MSIKKSKRWFIFILCVFVVLFTIILLIYYNHKHKTFDPSKPNIFEIPGTESSYNPGNGIYHERYFMIQKLPDSTGELNIMVNNYLNELGLNVTSLGNSHAIFYYFMVPSNSFPVYFTENGRYYDMDDQVANYVKTNCVVTVCYIEKTEPEYILHESIFLRYK